MGRLSDKKRSARLLGKRQRARVKKRRRGWFSTNRHANVTGAGTSWITLRAGRKKQREAGMSKAADNPWSWSHSFRSCPICRGTVYPESGDQ